MEQNEINYLQQLEAQLNQAQVEKAQISNVNAQLGLLQNSQEDSIVKWQMDLKEIFDRISHTLGYVRKEYEDGTEQFEKAKDKEQIVNEKGLQLIMYILHSYLNKNTILSYYDDEQINFKIKKIGREIVKVIHEKDEEIGFDTSEKRKMMRLVAISLIDEVNSAYNRARFAHEANSMRKIVTETINQNNNPMMNKSGMQMNYGGGKQTKWYNPKNWF
jgi:hypothetical protein